MTFTFPDGLSPEVYPLAWLVGRWRGEGVIEYPGIGRKTFVQDLVFDHDGGPYLRFESTLRVLDAAVPDKLPDDGEWPAPVPDPIEADAPAPPSRRPTSPRQAPSGPPRPATGVSPRTGRKGSRTTSTRSRCSWPTPPGASRSTSAPRATGGSTWRRTR